MSEKPIDGYIPILRSNNIKNSNIDLEDLVYVNPSRVKNRQFLRSGDILITASTGSIKVIGKNAYCVKDYDASFGAFCKVVRPKNIEATYLKHMFQSPQYFSYIQNVVNGANINNIKNEHLDNFKIPLPPLATQKRIAQILDDAAALRDKTAQLLKEYDALAQSIFLEMFGDPVTNPKGWDSETINNCSKRIQIGPFGSQLHQSDYQDFGFSLVNPTDIIDSKININRCRKIDKNKFDSLTNYHLEIGDIIMARRGDLSKIALVQDRNLFCGTGSLYIRFNNRIIPTFSKYYISHSSTISKLYEKARGITMANLNKSIIKNLDIIVPPIDLQNQFEEKIALIEQQKVLAKQELKESEDLFNCLLQKAFKGEIQ
ncbi:restriction endonuclease subunit S [Arenibacter latericius]|uniref:restriction endonuclease subunit S n=1 Tax=Arenibacter latericius TaxID=86104 RepID=UPI000424DC34|nr:restriction endonuclease subunit S [Arenibacter latericius]